MKTKGRGFIYVFIVVLIAGGIYLWNEGRGSDSMKHGPDPDSYDVTVTCQGMDGHNLECNKENDTYLFLDGASVFVEKVETEVAENGDVTTEKSYKKSSIAKLSDKIKDKGEVSLNLWLTPNGKVSTIVIHEESYTDNNASKLELNGLDPSTFDASNEIIGITNKTLKVAPLSYSGDEKKRYKQFIAEYKLSRTVKAYSQQIRSKIDGNGEKKMNIQFSKSSLAEVKKMVESGSATAHIWFNKWGNVQVILLYGETTVWE